MPKPWPSDVVGALGDKSHNASLKSRGRLVKRDTKNLNRKAPKPSVPYGVGNPSPFLILLADTIHAER